MPASHHDPLGLHKFTRSVLCAVVEGRVGESVFEDVVVMIKS
jgi:hypothetical protein